MGPWGSGHYVKMVHNGIEYGLLEAYAEGYRYFVARAAPQIQLVVALLLVPATMLLVGAALAAAML